MFGAAILTIVFGLIVFVLLSCMKIPALRCCTGKTPRRMGRGVQRSLYVGFLIAFGGAIALSVVGMWLRDAAAQGENYGKCAAKQFAGSLLSQDLQDATINMYNHAKLIMDGTEDLAIAGEVEFFSIFDTL